ncbi:MAG TPA: M28 family metallopeptidase [Anaerolineales bacterium]|nr:M28 family metallopeptidase [Anaerolineales bacterium]
MKTIGEQALEHVRHLSVDIGTRPIGSAANRAAADAICRIFERCGLTVETQEIPCPDWSAGHTSLELNGELLEASANTFSPSCDITASILPICTPAELEQAEISGRIPVFYGDMAQTELATKGGIYVSERDRRILQLLEERHPAGIITVNPTLHARWRLIEDFDLDIPSVTVSASSGLKLLKSPGAVVQMKIAASRIPSHTSNVIGRLPGDIPERIVFCAHYDSKVDTPGAYDNAAGVGVLLTLAEILSQGKHRHTLEWIAFTGEEGAGLGDMEYASRLENGFDQVAAAINIDGVGPYTGTTTAATFSASPDFDALVDAAIRKVPSMIRVEPWPASDHYIFYSQGVPSIALTSRGIRDIYHTLSDTVEWISAEKLAESVRLVLDLFEELDKKDGTWGRPRK